MNSLLMLIGWEYKYEINIRSLTEYERIKLKTHADYIKECEIRIKEINKSSMLFSSRSYRKYDLWEYKLAFYG